jgi:fatty acid amide hydrolase 2
MFRPSDFSYTAIFNVLGVPVTQVPLGLGEKGLPVGIQIVGGLNSDLLTLRIAEILEEGFGGWVEPGQAPKSPKKSRTIRA